MPSSNLKPPAGLGIYMMIQLVVESCRMCCRKHVSAPPASPPLRSSTACIAR